MLLSALLVFFGVKVTTEEVKDLAQPDARFDFPGSIAFAVFLAGIILSVSFGNSYIPFGTPLSYILMVATVVGLIVLAVVIAKKKEGAIIPMPVLKDRNTMIFTGVAFFVTFSSMAIFFFIPSYILYIMGGTAVEAAIASACMAALGVFLGPFFGRAIAKSGNARTVMTIGVLERIAVTIAFILLLKPSTPMWLVFALMFLGGFYNSQHSVTNSAGPQIQISDHLRLLSNSVVQVSQNLGSTIGMMVYTLLIGFGLADGLPIALWVAVGAAVIAFVFGLFLKPLPQSAQGAKAAGGATKATRSS
jgi:predicted MFS family arabinose efflux permease